MKEPSGLGRMWSLYKKGGVTPAIASMLGMQNAHQMAQIRNMNREQLRLSVLETPIHELDIVVFDLETTGFHVNNGDEIISFGAIKITKGEIRRDQTFHSFVNPHRAIPEDVIKLTGISNEEVESAPELIEVLSQFMSFVGKSVLVAHASGHDKQFLNQALWRTSKTQLNHRVVDTMMLAKWLQPELGRYDLDSCLLSNNIPITTRHHALADAIMTAELWSCYIKKAAQRNITCLSDLYAYLSKR